MNLEEQKKCFYMFERVNEPLYMGPRGPQGNLTQYNVPMDGLSPEARERIKAVLSSSNLDIKSSFMIRQPKTIPDLRPIGMAVPRTSQFSYFIPSHRQAADQLYNLLMEQTTMDEFFNMAAHTRDNPNVCPTLWVHAMSRVALNRKEMRGMKLPPIREIMPDLFIPTNVIQQAEKQGKIPVQRNGKPMRQVIMINGPVTNELVCPSEVEAGARNSRQVDITIDKSFSGRNENVEHRLAYWREDLGIASHHYHFHLIYVVSAPASGPGSRDRKGEIFYYMHHGMIGRYEAERLSNDLPRTRVLDLAANQTVKEAYFSKLRSTNSGANWGNRQENTVVKPVQRETFMVSPEDLRRWKDRIYDAIDTGFVMNSKGEKIVLTESTGIDILGSLVEASNISVNRRFYGNVHNSGHILLGLSHDPLKHHNESFGPMGSESTACRDPVFFRWHKYIDQLFDYYKMTLDPYTEAYLVWGDVNVDNVEVVSRNAKEKNALFTRWGQRDLDLSRGLDLNRMDTGGKIWARYTHLDHTEFIYNIHVNNVTTRPLTGTFRIFMAPRLNEHGERFEMREQRSLFFEMDKFWMELKPGVQVITRRSTESSLTVPWEQSFSDLDQPFIDSNSRANKPTEAICSCGWPQHLLLPKGKPEGMTFDLFVMVTDSREDSIKLLNENRPCKEAYSYCGRLDEKYPDRRPMGFPFDRKPREVPTTPGGTMPMPVKFLENFIPPSNSNMKAVQVQIYHKNCTVVTPAKETLGMSVLPPQELQEDMTRNGQTPSIIFEDSNLVQKPMSQPGQNQNPGQYRGQSPGRYSGQGQGRGQGQYPGPNPRWARTDDKDYSDEEDFYSS